MLKELDHITRRPPSHAGWRGLVVSAKALLLDLVWAAVNKFAGGTIVSAMVNEPPVWMKGGRHIVSFLLAFVATHLWPYDHFQKWLKLNNVAGETVMFSGVALYKLRKIAFSMVHPAFTDGQWYAKVALAVVTVEFSSFMRRWTDWNFKSVFFQKARASFSLENAWENGMWLMKRLSPGVMAILLVGMGTVLLSSFSPYSPISLATMVPIVLGGMSIVLRASRCGVR
jgi:hypothetical protein